MTAYQPKTGAACSCKRGQQRDNCPACEGTGQRIDFAAIRARNAAQHFLKTENTAQHVPTICSPANAAQHNPKTDEVRT